MTVFGLPLHPLIVHAVVVFVPLAALGGLLISGVRWARVRYGWLVVACALVGAVTTLVAQQAGKDLLATFQRPTAAVARHASIGDGLLVWAILLLVGTAVVMAGQWLIDRHDHRGRTVLIGGAVITVVTAVISLVQVVRIGHAGSVAVYGGG